LKKIFKKNQIIITALALMIAVAGYLSFTNGNLEDTKVAKEANADVADTYDYEISDEDTLLEGEIFTDTEDNSVQTGAMGSTETSGEVGMEMADASIDATETGADGEVDSNPGEAVLTSNTMENMDFAAEMKLNREQVRAKNKESLLEIVNNTNIDEAAKQEAVNQMIAMTNIAERETAAEMLLEAKGFTDVVVSITDNTADVVLNMGEVTDAKRAQIEDIVKRKTNISAENIIITPISTTAQ
jgi:stage III sporulation protein AH